MITLSKFIAELQGIEQKYGGNIKVEVFDPDQMVMEGELNEVEARIVFNENDDGKVDGISICDPETMSSFVDSCDGDEGDQDV